MTEAGCYSQAPHNAALKLDSLACHRGNHVLFSGLSLSVAKGEAIQITGANGQGKTTLLRTLTGLQQPVYGHVLRFGSDLHEMLAAERNLFYLAHENALNPDLTPRENLSALMQLQGDSGSPTQALKQLSVVEHADHQCRRLSAGQRRRVALARLALSQAGLWLLDEPAAALDADGRTVVCELMAAHVAKGGTLVFTTHEPLDLAMINVRTLSL